VARDWFGMGYIEVSGDMATRLCWVVLHFVLCLPADGLALFRFRSGAVVGLLRWAEQADWRRAWRLGLMALEA